MDPIGQLSPHHADVCEGIVVEYNVVEPISHLEDHVEVSVHEDAVWFRKLLIAEKFGKGIERIQNVVDNVKGVVLRHRETIQVEVDSVNAHTSKFISISVMASVCVLFKHDHHGFIDMIQRDVHLNHIFVAVAP